MVILFQFNVCGIGGEMLHSFRLRMKKINKRDLVLLIQLLFSLCLRIRRVLPVEVIEFQIKREEKKINRHGIVIIV